jgi:hypothetical protein
MVGVGTRIAFTVKTTDPFLKVHGHG